MVMIIVKNCQDLNNGNIQSQGAIIAGNPPNIPHTGIASWNGAVQTWTGATGGSGGFMNNGNWGTG